MKTSVLQFTESIMATGIKKIKNFNINGTSMFPLLHTSGDSVTLVQPHNIKLNDIVLYKRANGKYVLHRVVRIYNNNNYGLCGDNTYSIEQGISNEDIIAKVSEINRNGRYISLNSKIYKLYTYILVHSFPLRKLIHNIKHSNKNQEDKPHKYIIAFLDRQKRGLFSEQYFYGFISSGYNITPSLSKAMTFNNTTEAQSVLEKYKYDNKKSIIYPVPVDNLGITNKPYKVEMK